MVAKNKGKWVRRNVDERRAVLSRFEGSGLGAVQLLGRLAGCRHFAGGGDRGRQTGRIPVFCLE